MRQVQLAMDRPARATVLLVVPKSMPIAGTRSCEIFIACKSSLDNAKISSMQTSCTKAILAACLFLLGSAAAQQTPAKSTTPPAKPRQSTGTTTQNTTPAAKPKPLALVTEKDKQSYAIGLSVGKNLQRDSLDVEPKIVLQGIEDALGNGKLLLTDDQIKT